MDYLLRFPIEDVDCDFLNSTSIKYDVVDAHKDTITKLATDVDDILGSGWCDMATGARIVDERDRVVFRDVSPQELTLLLIKYPKRLKKMTGGFRSIYDEAEQHNVGPNSVIDSDTEI